MFDLSLSNEEERALSQYTGELNILYSKGVEVSRVDTRNLEMEKLKAQKELKRITNQSILRKAPLHKQLNMSRMEDEERAMYEVIINNHIMGYDQAKRAISAAVDCEKVNKALEMGITALENL